VSRSSGLLRLEASQDKVSQSGLKTVEGATWMVQLTSSCRLRRDKAEDEWVHATCCVGSFYHNLSFSMYYDIGVF
jgi:hypothetical protein